MKIIVPLAGKGTRLLPLTKRVPKPLVKVAGRPVMDYVMDAVKSFDVDELIVITGHLKEDVERYITTHYRVRARFVEQKRLDGTAGAVDLARPYVDQDVLIIFVDTLFDADLSVINTSKADAIIWVKEVEDYKRFGVIVTDEHSHMTRIVEKPEEPISRLANIGLHYVKDWRSLYDGIDWVRQRPAGKGGEYYLTDAFQHMVDQGRKILAAPVSGWYDCGKVDTLLETNHHLLENGRARQPANPGVRVTLLPPVHIEDGVALQDCRIGPNVTIESGSVIADSRISNSILGRDVRVSGSTIKDSLVGDGQTISGRTVDRLVIDRGEEASAG